MGITTKGKGLQLTIVERDLFTMEKEYVLAHCVSNDCKLGAGIALEFRRRIPEMPDILKRMNPSIGDAIRYHTKGGRIVINLFTKERYFDKPTLESLATTLYVLRRTMREQGYKKLAIPQIGCGLDKLNWEDVEALIHYIFKEEEMDIVVCVKK